MSSKEKITIEYQDETIELSKKHDDFCFKIAVHNKNNTECYIEDFQEEIQTTGLLP